MNNKELKVRDKCRKICNGNNKDTSIALIKEEFEGCAVTVAMSYGAGGMKMTMGMIMWQDISISF